VGAGEHSRPDCGGGITTLNLLCRTRSSCYAWTGLGPVHQELEKGSAAHDSIPHASIPRDTSIPRENDSQREVLQSRSCPEHAMP
jgi:hypothetical protein